MKNIKYIILSCMFICAVISCATPPKGRLLRLVTKNIKLPAYPQENESIVYIIRPSIRYGKHTYSTYLNSPDEGSLAGYTKEKQYIYFHVPIGKSRIYCHADNGAWIDLDAKGGKVYFIEQVIKSGVIRGRISLRFIDFYSGKWWIKRLKRGIISESFR